MERLIPGNGSPHNNVVTQDGLPTDPEAVKGRESANNPYFSPEEKIEALLLEIENLRSENQTLEIKNSGHVEEIIKLRAQEKEHWEERKRLERDVEEQTEKATKDSLTGLPNRGAFEDILEKLREQNENSIVKRYSVLAMDLDGFKAINDRFGHAAGDRCLKLVAEEVHNALRTSDFFAREGGDEFLILLQDVGEYGAKIVGEKILATINENVARRLKEELGDNTVTVSASIGIVSYGDRTGEKEIDQEMIVKKADYLRYLVKAYGKKAVMTLQEAEEEYDVDGVYEAQFLKSIVPSFKKDPEDQESAA